MSLYALAGAFLLGILATVIAGYIAQRKDEQHHKHVLGGINQKLKYTGTVERIKVRRGNKNKP